MTGIIVLLFGLWLVYVLYPDGKWATLYGLFVAGIGVAIMMNKQEDAIEEITNEED